MNLPLSFPVGNPLLMLFPSPFDLERSSLVEYFSVIDWNPIHWFELP
jgi:hypothetical protein